MAGVTNFKINGVDLSECAEIKMNIHPETRTGTGIFNSGKCPLAYIEISNIDVKNEDDYKGNFHWLNGSFQLVFQVTLINGEIYSVTTPQHQFTDVSENDYGSSAYFDLDNNIFIECTTKGVSNLGFYVSNASNADSIILKKIIYYTTTFTAPSGYLWSNNITGNKINLINTNGGTMIDSISAKGCRPQMKYYYKNYVEGTHIISVDNGNICVDSTNLGLKQSEHKYVYIGICGAGGGGGSGSSWNQGGGAGGSGGSGALFCVAVPESGEFIKIVQGAGGTSSAGSSGTNGDNTAIYYIYNNNNYIMASAIGGNGGAQGYNGGKDTLASSVELYTYNFDKHHTLLDGWSGGIGGCGHGYDTGDSHNGGSINKTVAEYDVSTTFMGSGGTGPYRDGEKVQHPGGGGGAGALGGNGGSGGYGGNSSTCIAGEPGGGGGGGPNTGIFASDAKGIEGGNGYFVIYI